MFAVRDAQPASQLYFLFFTHRLKAEVELHGGANVKLEARHLHFGCVDHAVRFSGTYKV